MRFIAARTSARIYDVVAVEHSTHLMAADLHCPFLIHSRLQQVLDRGPSKVMQNQTSVALVPRFINWLLHAQAGRYASLRPFFAEVRCVEDFAISVRRGPTCQTFRQAKLILLTKSLL